MVLLLGVSKFMAHFAQLDEHNQVINIVKINNEDMLDNGVESEQLGINLCKQIHGENTRWVQTSYNHSFRGHYATIGDTYNELLDIFVVPKPYPSWTFDSAQKDWIAPVPIPDNTNVYGWQEQEQRWILADPELPEQ